MNQDELMNADYPIPDPAWDYFTIYQNCQQARVALQDLIEFMSQFEDAYPDADAEIKVRLDAIGQQLNQTRRMMDGG
jgi:hypothetical protein